MSTGMICSIKEIRDHPNAGLIKLASFDFGVSVIVGPSAEVGDLGIYFPPGTQIDNAVLLHNSLYRKHPDTQQPMGGYFEANGKVKAIKIRGEMSNGIFMDISNFSFLSANLDWAIEGRELDSINGKTICRKFVYEDKQQHNNHSKGADKSVKTLKYLGFNQVGDTPRFIYNLHTIKPGDYIVITEKLHGTSGRSGHVRKLTVNYNWFYKLLYPFVKPPLKEQFVSIWGTRRTVGINKEYYRQAVHESFADSIPEDTVLYYEIVGPGIMPEHDASSHPDIYFKYDKKVSYNYGVEKDKVSVFLYGATRILKNGEVIVLPFWELEKLAANLGIDCVPVLHCEVFDGDIDRLKNVVLNLLSDGPSVLDPSHPREGVVVRVNNDVYKHKGNTFCLLEDIKPYHDPEDYN